MSDSFDMHEIAKSAAPASRKAAAKPLGKFKKAPGAPRRFKSAFIFFSTEKHKEIRQQLGSRGSKEKTTNVAKLVSEAWKNLPADEREVWEEKARRDKERYEVEKTMYSGPWKVPADKKAPKDPNAPKRPMSAFLSFSNSKRAAVKRQNPNVSNAEVSRILSRMWKDAPTDERQMHIDEEFELRQKYKEAMGEWRANEEKEKELQRRQREELALQTLDQHKRQMMDREDDGIASSSPPYRHHPQQQGEQDHTSLLSLMRAQQEGPEVAHDAGSSRFGAEYSTALARASSDHGLRSNTLAGLSQALASENAMSSLLGGGSAYGQGSLPLTSILAQQPNHAASLHWAQREQHLSNLAHHLSGAGGLGASAAGGLGPTSSLGGFGGSAADAYAGALGGEFANSSSAYGAAAGQTQPQGYYPTSSAAAAAAAAALEQQQQIQVVRARGGDHFGSFYDGGVSHPTVGMFSHQAATC